MSNNKIKLANNINFVLDLDEIESVKNLINTTLYDDSYNKLNYMKNSLKFKTTESSLTLSSSNGSLEFISINKDNFSPYNSILSEEEFFEIIGMTKKGISKRSGKYQVSLYSFYLQAKDENDKGFINDIFSKAIVFRNNLNYVKTLSQNKDFKRIWRKNFGNKNPVTLFKDNGDMKLINTINELMSQ